MKNINIDIKLLTDASKGNRKAQYSLYKYCFGMLMPVCFRYTKNEEFAREELSMAFVKIIDALKKFKPEKGFDPWAKRITVNSIIDNYRKNKKHQFHQEIDNEIVERKIKHTNPIDEKIGYDEIISLLDQIPEGSKKVFNLYVIEGYKHDEIAEMLDFTVSNSKWHLANARKLMKSLILKQRHIAILIIIALL